jgi:hypothetical protein
MRGALLGGALALSLFSMSGEATAADITKGQCVDANTNGQTLRKDGKLTASRAQFQMCNDPKCPEIVRADCTQRLEEIEAAFPSIVFDTKKADGSDLVDVKVTMDGKVVAEKMDGSPLTVDPGSHEFTFEAAGEKPLTRTFVLKEGEKLRRERIQIGEAPPAPAEPAKPPPTAPPPPKNGGNGDLLRIGGLGLAGAGIVALGVGVFYGLKASSKWSDQQDHCKSATDCSNHPQAISDHDGAVVYGRFSTMGVIAGAVLLAGGVVMYLVAPKNGTTDTKSGRLSDPFKFSF